MAIDAEAFRKIAPRTLATAPSASIYYLEAKLILAALAHRVDLVRAVTGAGAQVDTWTIDDLGCHQITSNDPERLYPIIDGLAV